MGEVLTARIRLIDEMQFAAEAGSGHTVILDAAEHAGGHGAGFVPMEMLLVGLAGCTGMDVISILRKKRQQVTGYEVRVRGERAEDHPMVYTDITVEHLITGRNVSPEAVARAIEISESKYCGAGAMLGKTANLIHTFRIVEALPEAEPVHHASSIA
ncbi:MAG: OsmC family protein [Ktedonobacterales bacterium]